MKRHRLIVGAASAGLVITALVAAPGQAAPGHSDTHRKTLPNSVPSWAQKPAMSANAVSNAETIQFNVLLPLKHPQKAEEFARAVATPGSPVYGDYLSEAEFAKRFGPSHGSTMKVTNWLKHQGFEVEGPQAGNMYVAASGSVAEVEAAFDTQLRAFSVDGQSLRAPASPMSVPASVASSVVAVTGVDQSGLLIRPTSADVNSARNIEPAKSGKGYRCSRWWGEYRNSALPKRLKHQPTMLCNYSKGGYTWRQTRKIMNWRGSARGKGQTVGIVLAYSYPHVRSDASKMARNQHVRRLTKSHYTAKLDKPERDKARCGGESSWSSELAMDVQAVHNMSPAAKIIYYGADSCATIPQAFARAVHDGKASVLSGSFGYNDGAVGPGDPAYKVFHRNMLKAATKGISVLFSSGDRGTYKITNGETFLSYPSSDPLATAVGGISAGLGKHNGIKFRTGWEWQAYELKGNHWRKGNPCQVLYGVPSGNCIGAGGGVSKEFSQPKWQRYLPGSKLHKPDIAGLSDPFTGMRVGSSAGGGWDVTPGGGTSLSAPLVAGMVANANQTQNRRIGFLNPALYSLRGTNGLKDIWHHSVGFTVPLQGGRTALVQFDGSPESIRSHRGYDHVTGLGIPGPGFYHKLGRR